MVLLLIISSALVPYSVTFILRITARWHINSTIIIIITLHHIGHRSFLFGFFIFIIMKID